MLFDIREVCEAFISIVRFQKKPVAVYGLGKYARLVGRKYPESIVCFLDGERTEGFFLGKPVKSLKTISELGVSAIVIAGGMRAEWIVYERIWEFCHVQGVALFGLHSGDLSHAGKLLSDFNLDGADRRAGLWQEIGRHEVICFDIFDTLLMRRTLYPMDVFDITAYRARRKGIALPHGFKAYRNQAETGVVKLYGGLAGIYRELQVMLNLTESEAKIVMETEMQVEREVLLPRPTVVEAMHYAKNLGRQVLLVSDMYLPTEFLREVLVEHGIIEYDGLYISDDQGTGKSENLFNIVCREHPAGSYLHIGDNPEVDGWGARRNGLDAFLIQSALDMFRYSGISQPFKYLAKVNERLLVGLFLSEAYADPFCTDAWGRRTVRDVVDFVGLFTAPLATSLVIWLLEKSKEQGVEAVLFAARDGYLFKQMYDEAIGTWEEGETPRSVYLSASRKLCLSLAMREPMDLEWVHKKLQGGMRYFVQDTFHLNLPMSENEEDAEDSELVWQAVQAEKKSIFQCSAEARSGYRKYLAGLGLKQEGRYVFFDMCSKGTSQQALVRSVLPHLYGLYMQRYLARDTRTMGKVETFLPQEPQPMLINNVFEFVFTSQEPSAKGVSADGSIIFDEEVRTEEELLENRRGQQRVMDYFRQFLCLALDTQKMSGTVGQQILDIYHSDSFQGGIEILSRHVISDDLAGRMVPCLKPEER